MRTNKKKTGLRLLATPQDQTSVSMRSLVVNIAKGLCFGLLIAGFIPQQATAVNNAGQLSNLSRPLSEHDAPAASSTIGKPPVTAHRPKRADFKREIASNEARQMADWIVDSGDNHTMPFVIVDKKDAKVFLFDADGLLRGSAPALLGLAIGDEAVPGIGSRKLSSIRPEERTTPAGRFVAALGRNLHGKKILWVDYDGAVSIHPVVTAKPAERRAERLATPTPLDNRISYGCINVPAKFFKKVVLPAFTGTNGIVYVLPETPHPR
jgi:hypothetical protein